MASHFFSKPAFRRRLLLRLVRFSTTNCPRVVSIYSRRSGARSQTTTAFAGQPALDFFATSILLRRHAADDIHIFTMLLLRGHSSFMRRLLRHGEAFEAFLDARSQVSRTTSFFLAAALIIIAR